MQVSVRDNNVDQALRALKKKLQREGVFREMKLRQHFEKPSEKKAREKAEAIEGLEIVTYHNSWPYFTRAFGVEVVGFVQPKPGIEPTPGHTANLIDLVNGRGIEGRTKVEPGDTIRFGSVSARLCSAQALWLALAG